VVPYDACLAPVVICHDQEPLDFESHQFDHDLDRLRRLFEKRDFVNDDLEMRMMFYSNLSAFPEFRANWLSSCMLSWHDWIILLHSEKNSEDVEKFSQERFLPVYYWAHAVIAKDWYRFAEHDLRLNKRNVEKTFLIYCRDWMPNREYRLKFLDLLVSSKINDDCKISTQHINNQGTHLRDYQAQDPRFAVDTNRLLCIPNNISLPSSSADYDVIDITTTAVSVVLETVVDGSKIHLTEKILRSIACSHPFVLLAGPGALAYLRDYGFKTFSEFWDEGYDQECDTVKRMELIVQTMQKIQQLPESDWILINEIAKHNKRHFFSERFMNQVVGELQTNLDHAVNFCLENRGRTFLEVRKFIRRSGLSKHYPSFKDEFTKNSIRELRRHRSTRFRNVSAPIIGQ
jgi:hypothetical protein